MVERLAEPDARIDTDPILGDPDGLGPMQDGESVTLEVEGLGRLTVNVRDEYGRTWRRETVAEQEARERAKKNG